MAGKLGAVRQDPDLHGLLFILINRATGGRQERAADLGPVWLESCAQASPDHGVCGVRGPGLVSLLLLRVLR